MLVLSRKVNEAVVIGDDVRVTVVEIRGDKVRLGFEAPNDVTVHRQEVWMAIQRENGNPERGTNALGGEDSGEGQAEGRADCD